MPRPPLSTLGRRARALVGVGFLGFQLFAIARSRVVPSRYFAWAPYDAISLYELDVQIEDRALTTAEVEARYRLGVWFFSSIQWSTRTLRSFFSGGRCRASSAGCSTS